MQMNRLVVAMRQDMDPSNILDNIDKIDAEMARLERKFPSDCDQQELDEISEMINANQELRAKVNDVSEMVKNTLTKINVTGSLTE